MLIQDSSPAQLEVQPGTSECHVFISVLSDCCSAEGTGIIHLCLPPANNPGRSGSGVSSAFAAATFICAVETPRDSLALLIVFGTLTLLTILIIQIYLRMKLIETQLVN